ncbi:MULTISPECIES: invasion associated locus B family protein [unclassified Paracoccus (in: a-proteobacteria)]|uniref:invasion associated locus B family protein n=1 Tax=unclassified Paracoccus (in: a-proteobacteria) TaxID=2688777 RepID=UPI001602C398|nr:MULTISPECIES: invasion associated locus B family protein [unclassified Paracoccus (in: a-proteobacteria)]MBB1492229.1 invasion associated locus B family protein [Paracoccus sp. MC1854]MBB1498689.1 invasion associated locus B family protein [Paracoccus sp. MC1862]QQO45625.1 invasion associated locus B family protein [Paracoccus sp. MC1862]
MARTSSAVLAALIAVAPFAAAHAQEPTEQTPPPVTAPAETTDAPAADAAPPQAESGAEAAPAGTPADAEAPAEGQAAAAQDQVGSYYAKATHGDWQLRCLRTPDGKDPCELYQLLRDEKETPVAELSVIPFSGEAAAVLNFVAPLETDLQAGMGLQIGSGEANRYPFIVCAAIGCVSRLGMTEDELNLLKRGSTATVTLLPFGGEPEENMVDLTVSLAGFTAGFTELQGLVGANQ